MHLLLTANRSQNCLIRGTTVSGRERPKSGRLCGPRVRSCRARLCLPCRARLAFAAVAAQKCRTDWGSPGPLRSRSERCAGRKPAWILDGYELLLAFGEAENSQFAVPVLAIVCDDPSVFRDQFAFLQKRCLLPPELGDKLFPKAGAGIRRTVGPRELPREVCDWLNADPGSPFHRLIEPKDGTGRTGSRFPVSRRALVEVIRGKSR